jgi:hypothetical protein
MTIPRTRQNHPPSATERVAKLRLLLKSISLAELDEQGIVIWDKENHVVREGPNFDAKAAEVLDNGQTS